MAISGRWDEAVEKNRFILEAFGPDEDTHNRLGKAYSELGHLDEGLQAYNATLKINPMNAIARRNLRRIEALMGDQSGVRGSGSAVDLNLFVEEMGKTIITVLEGVRDRDIASKVAPGDAGELLVEGDAISIETHRGVRVGNLESKLARRLIKLIRGGNKYQAGITSVEEGTIRVIVREIHQDPRLSGKPSFPIKRKREVEFRPYTKESRLAREIEDYDADDDDGPRMEVSEDESEESDELEGMSVVDEDADAESVEDFSEDADGDAAGDDEEEE